MIHPKLHDERLLRIPAFASEALGNERGIHIYLPPGYNMEPDRCYPVLYMHDGQGIFEPNPFSNSSWQVHQTADRLISEGLMEPILIVGIENNGEDRMNEYAFGVGEGTSIPNDPKIVACKGEAYEKFLIEELKPFIDRSFRTLPDREHTALMGSSMGGLVTYHLGFRNPHVFSKLGILSPYFIRLDPNTLEENRLYNRYNRTDLKLWVDIGEIEANILVRHVRGVVQELVDQGYMPGEDLMFYEVPGAAHTEEDWAERVHMPLLYFFGQVGQPVSVKLYGSEKFGLTGMTNWLNPVVTYDTGFRMTDLNGHFEVDDPSMLTVGRDGVVKALQEGTTCVVYSGLEVRAEKGVTVVGHLSEHVEVSISIVVPPDTPAKATLLIGKLVIPRVSDKLFYGEFRLPRDMTVRCKILTDLGVQEAGANGEEIPYRMIRWGEERNPVFHVEAWERRGE